MGSHTRARLDIARHIEQSINSKTNEPGEMSPQYRTHQIYITADQVMRLSTSFVSAISMHFEPAIQPTTSSNLNAIYRTRTWW
jgi:hypothetical protein